MKLTNEIKIGILFVVILAGLAVLTFKAGDFKLKEDDYVVKVRFLTIDGIDTNSPVMLNGLEVGRVQEIEIIEDEKTTRMQLDVWMEADAKLKEGATAYVKNMGFLGEKYVGLTAGRPGGAYLKEGAIIIGEEPADFDKLMIEGQDLVTNFKEVAENLNARLKTNKERIDQIFENVDVAMKKIRSISENVDERLTKNEKNIDDILANLRSATINLDQMTYDLKLNPWKLLYKSKEKRMKNINEE